ncbi:hypothetical protein CHUBBYTHOR_130 [Shigella phage ChubbyThor]|nr:hypothetical protein CHUBBYTHOR_130 [Shigella phage ChubbyThor]
MVSLIRRNRHNSIRRYKMSKPNFLQFMQEKDQLDEAFNSAPYELTMGKKNAGDVFFTFIDEDEKEYRIQFYTPQGLGKNVRQVFIGQKRGSVYPDAIARFKNPMRVIASMIEATKQFLATPLGKTIDGYAVNFSKKALERGMTLIPKIIRQSGLKQKLNVMDLTYAPVPDRGYVWLVRKGKDPAQVFDGPKMQGITWDDPDKVGDVPVQNNTPDVGTSSNNPDWNISVMAKSNGIFSSVVKVVGANDVTLSSNDLAIMVKDGAMAKIARTQTIAQVTVFNKEYVGRGEVDRKLMAASDRQGMGWELKSGGKIIAYVEFGVGATSIQGDDIIPPPGLSTTARNNYVAKAKADKVWAEINKLDSNIRRKDDHVFVLSSKFSEILISATGAAWEPSDTTIKSDYLVYKDGKLVDKAADLKYRDFKSAAQAIVAQFHDLYKKYSSGPTISSKDLRIPKNASVFGETENGMSITWSGINFPETGKYAGTSMITNVTYYHDKGKVAFTPIVSQKGRTLNNPKTYELPLNKDLVQSVINEISSKMEYLSRNLQQLKSQTYNPNQVFLNDITITDKGEVIWNDYNLSDGKVTQIMLSMISAENKRLEKVTNNPDITLPKKQAEVVEFINRMIDIDLGPYLREPKKRDVVLFDSSELSINQLNNIERLGRETGKWSLQSNGGMGHALFLNVW